MIAAWLLAAAWAVPVAFPGGGHAENPQWSPDGAWLAFEVNNHADQLDLWVVSVTGGKPAVPRRIPLAGASTSSFSSGARFAANPAWVPGGGLLFEGGTAAGVVRLFYATAGSAAPAVEYLSTSKIAGNLAWPAVSPSGQTVAFTSSATGAGDIYLHQVRDGSVSRAFNSEFPENAPQFSPEGTGLVFSRKVQGTEDLAGWSVGTTMIQPLQAGNHDQTRPRYAGGKIVYFTGERGGGHWDVAVADPTPGAPRTILARDVRLPSRSPPQLGPDGRSVVWASMNADQDHQVMVTRLDGSGTIALDTGLVAVADPTLVAAGGRVYLAFTALPAVGSTWRQLHVLDVTGKI